jgi:hypothetical protein
VLYCTQGGDLMNKFKKSFSVIILLLIFTFSWPTAVFANAPAPADHLTVALANIPDNAVYADLLIKISQDDADFIDFQPNDYADFVSNSSEIVTYSQDGYYSFTFHYKDSKSYIKIDHYYDDLDCVKFCEGLEYNEYLTQYESLLNNYNDVKIALLDKDFNIITVSNAAKLPEVNNLYNFYGEINYDFTDNKIDVDISKNYYFIVFGGIFLIGIMSMSIGIEVLVSLLFGFRGKRLLIILLTNTCTQIIMRLLYLVLPFTYLIETIILEIMVYVTEFLIYKKYLKQEKTTTIGWYTVIANTLSLMLGIWFNSYILAI